MVYLPNSVDWVDRSKKSCIITENSVNVIFVMLIIISALIIVLISWHLHIFTLMEMELEIGRA